MKSRVKSWNSVRGGFTIVEMMVTIVIVLIVMLAVVQLFEWIGVRVAQGRAVIEMSGVLRGATRRLELDLETCTVPVRPWIDPAAGEGYFELYEGAANDLSVYRTMQAAVPPVVPESIAGDFDDILMLTCRNRDEPFSGHRDYLTLDAGNNFAQPAVGSISSEIAEVVWWTQWDDFNSNGQVDRPEVTLRRRAMVIRPDLNNQSGMMTRLAAANLNDLRILVANFMHNNDISVRLWIDPVNNLICNVTANSLSDLTRRENRYAHWRVLTAAGANVQYASMPWPFPIDAMDDYAADHDFATFNFSVTSLRRLAKARALPSFLGEDVSRYGEDVIAAGVLAFDIRVYDPEALIFSVDGNGVAPGDAAWGTAFDTYIQNPVAPNLPIGKGAFVDLGYLPRHNMGNGGSHYSDIPDERSGLLHWFNPVVFGNSTTFRMLGPRSAAFDYNVPANLYNNPGRAPAPLFDKQFGGPRVYCTWPTHYEKDGLNQSLGQIAAGIPDIGTDGFDNNGINGTDDDGERETAPPYPFKLRGINVSLRLYENDTRQVKQSTVTANFVPE